MLDVQALVLHGDGLLHGDDVHTHAAATGRHQMRFARQRHIGHALKEGGQLRMLGKTLVVGNFAPLVVAGVLAAAAFIDVQQLRRAGYEHGHKVPPLGLRSGAAVVVIVIAVVVFQQTQERKPVQDLLKMGLALLGHVAELPEFRDGVGLAQAHGQHNVAHFVGQQSLQAPVFRILGGDFAEFVVNDVGDHLADLHDFFPWSLVPLGLRIPGSLFQFFIDHEILPF